MIHCAVLLSSVPACAGSIPPRSGKLGKGVQIQPLLCQQSPNILLVLGICYFCLIEFFFCLLFPQEEISLTWSLDQLLFRLRSALSTFTATKEIMRSISNVSEKKKKNGRA